MDKKLEEREGPVLGFESCADLLTKLQVDGKRLEDNAWHQHDSFNFVLTAWHLQNDWLRQPAVPKPALAARKATKANLPQLMCMVLDVLRDLCNGSKHRALKPQDAQRRVVVETHSGQIGSWYSFFFRERIPGITTETYYYFSIRKLRDIMLTYFDWVFDDSIPVSAFPGTLLWTIWRCNPANRVPTAVPPLGAIPDPREDPGFVV